MSGVVVSNKPLSLNSEQLNIMQLMLEKELLRVKAVVPHKDHEVAVTLYKKKLIVILLKINPKGYYYAN